MSETTGEKVRLARERLVIGQAELARAAGLTQSAIWHIERGGRTPREATIRKLADAMAKLSGKPVDPSELKGQEVPTNGAVATPGGDNGS